MIAWLAASFGKFNEGSKRAEAVILNLLKKLKKGTGHKRVTFGLSMNLFSRAKSNVPSFPILGHNVWNSFGGEDACRPNWSRYCVMGQGRGLEVLRMASSSFPSRERFAENPEQGFPSAQETATQKP